jgi:hypothetical protein
MHKKIIPGLLLLLLLLLLATNVIRLSVRALLSIQKSRSKEFYHGEEVGENCLMHAKVKTVFRWKTRAPPT